MNQNSIHHYAEEVERLKAQIKQMQGNIDWCVQKFPAIADYFRTPEERKELVINNQKSKETELLTAAVRHTQLSAGIAGEMARLAQASDDGLPLDHVQESLAYWDTHLREARAALMTLRKIAKQKQKARARAKELCNTEHKLKQ